MFSCHYGNHTKETATETSPKNQKKTRNHSILFKLLNPAATAESIVNPATETIQKRCPVTTETITKEKPTTETIEKKRHICFL